LASAAGTRTLQTRILEKCDIAEEDIINSLSHWTSLASPQAPTNRPIQERSQKVWDNAVTDRMFQSLLNSQTIPLARARLLTAAAAHNGDWLHALPISACGLKSKPSESQSASGWEPSCVRSISAFVVQQSTDEVYMSTCCYSLPESIVGNFLKVSLSTILENYRTIFTHSWRSPGHQRPALRGGGRKGSRPRSLALTPVLAVIESYLH
jgi:hypothetical protein